MIFKIIFSENFRVPLIVLVGILIYLILKILNLSLPANILVILITILGSYQLFWETFINIRQKRLALDYIAIVAILVALYTNQFLVAAILALMISSGRTLEEYAVSQAKKSLTNLIARIPDEVFLYQKDKTTLKVKIKSVEIGQEIFIRKGEVIPLDGLLISNLGQTDESSLTGEPYFIDKIKGDILRSGTVNIGSPIILKVTKVEGDSTYNKIVELVKKAQNEQSPFIRLAEKYSTFFTLATFSIAALAYLTSNFDLSRVLSVLAIATPCPLIIATPIALLGGVNSAAKKRIIVKKLASLEVLSKVDTLVFDKTGTITLGKPKVTDVQVLTNKYTKAGILGIAMSLERNSLHPLAKAIVSAAQEVNVPIMHAKDITEVIGQGISGIIGKQKFILSKIKNDQGMSIELTTSNKRLAIFKFEDEIKLDSVTSFEKLKALGLDLKIFTGDKEQAAEKIVAQLNLAIEIKAQLSPEQKQQGIKKLQESGKIVGMIGDGINDAPSLATANVGLVFSNEEQTAASEAADIVFLGGDFSYVLSSLQIAKRTVGIATQSIVFGIGVSMIGMVFAGFGFIPPIFGAGLQELIDVAVIINAIRASN